MCQVYNGAHGIIFFQKISPLRWGVIKDKPFRSNKNKEKEKKKRKKKGKKKKMERKTRHNIPTPPDDISRTAAFKRPYCSFLGQKCLNK